RYPCNWVAGEFLSGRPGRRALLQELVQVGRVTDGVVGVAVVHDGVHLAGLRRHIAELGHPGLQLAGLVEIAEFFRGADPFFFPGLPIASVAAHHAEGRGHRHPRRPPRAYPPRLIAHDTTPSAPLPAPET